MTINSVLTAFRLLELIAEVEKVGLTALSRTAELPKGSVQRYLLTLKEAGWITETPDPPVQWQLTSRGFSVCKNAGSPSDIRQIAMPHLNNLQLMTTETVHLAVPDSRDVVLIERLDTSHPLRAFLPIGDRNPMHASATGLAIMSRYSDDRIEDYISQGLVQVTEKTITDPDVLRAKIDKVRELGYSTNDRGLSDGICSTGAAIVDAEGKPIASVSVSGPSSRLSPDRLNEYGPKAAAAARAISSEVCRLGPI
ncbi:IclR family transcriptional regulator [Brevibacterium sp. K11IcPPYGO002]|uniref:IclR family transcriptional regulator n=1 Tax=Brevibacterium sp. K11IcPPYGO002 TaxID=3058837 RepID=UPI003D813E28